MKRATLGQISKVEDLIREKGVSAENLQSLLALGLLARLFEADPTQIDIGEFCKVLHVENKRPPTEPEAATAWRSRFGKLKKQERDMLQTVAGFYDDRAAALELLTEAYFRFENSFVRGPVDVKKILELPWGGTIEATVTEGSGVRTEFVAAQRFAWETRKKKNAPHRIDFLKEALHEIATGGRSGFPTTLFGGSIDRGAITEASYQGSYR